METDGRHHYKVPYRFINFISIAENLDFETGKRLLTPLWHIPDSSSL